MHFFSDFLFQPFAQFFSMARKLLIIKRLRIYGCTCRCTAIPVNVSVSRTYSPVKTIFTFPVRRMGLPSYLAGFHLGADFTTRTTSSLRTGVAPVST